MPRDRLAPETILPSVPVVDNIMSFPRSIRIWTPFTSASIPLAPTAVGSVFLALAIVMLGFPEPVAAQGMPSTALKVIFPWVSKADMPSRIISGKPASATRHYAFPAHLAASAAHAPMTSRLIGNVVAF